MRAFSFFSAGEKKKKKKSHVRKQARKFLRHGHLEKRLAHKHIESSPALSDTGKETFERGTGWPGEFWKILHKM
jgi:hypothetical protein